MKLFFAVHSQKSLCHQERIRLCHPVRPGSRWRQRLPGGPLLPCTDPKPWGLPGRNLQQPYRTSSWGRMSGLSAWLLLWRAWPGLSCRTLRGWVLLHSWFQLVQPDQHDCHWWAVSCWVFLRGGIKPASAMSSRDLQLCDAAVKLHGVSCWVLLHPGQQRHHRLPHRWGLMDATGFYDTWQENLPAVIIQLFFLGGGGLSDFVCLNSLSFSCLVIIYCNAVGKDVDLEIFRGVPER